jgi:DNA-binding HxlR family transcriptional regulator
VLAEGTHRFGRLPRRIGGISQEMLTQTRRDLERDGLVERIVHSVVPPPVDDRQRGRGEPLPAIRVRAQAHLGEMLAARERSDRRAAARARQVWPDRARA